MYYEGFFKIMIFFFLFGLEWSSLAPLIIQKILQISTLVKSIFTLCGTFKTGLYIFSSLKSKFQNHSNFSLTCEQWEWHSCHWHSMHDWPDIKLCNFGPFCKNTPVLLLHYSFPFYTFSLFSLMLSMPVTKAAAWQQTHMNRRSKMINKVWKNICWHILSTVTCI